MATVSLQRAAADLPATRARRGGGDADPRTPGQQPRGGRRGLPARPSAVRAARCRTERACIQSFTAPPNSSKTGSQPLKHTVLRTTSVTPPTPATPGPRPRRARTSAFPQRAGEPRRPQHMRALCFPCSRALPTCRAGGTPAAPRRTALRSPELKLVGAGRGHTPAETGAACTGAELRERQDAIAARRTVPTPATPRTGPGAGRGRPHAATRATDSTCPASPRPHVLSLSSVHGLGPLRI